MGFTMKAERREEIEFVGQSRAEKEEKVSGG